MTNFIFTYFPLKRSEQVGSSGNLKYSLLMCTMQPAADSDLISCEFSEHVIDSVTFENAFLWFQTERFPHKFYQKIFLSRILSKLWAS